MDMKTLVQRAMEIDVRESAAPLSETQWEAGLDMLERRIDPPAGTGIALRQEAIKRAIERARAELDQA
jgi:hypothetical protein